MEDFIQFFVEQGLPLAYAVYGAILAWLFLAGMGAPLPEDVVMIAAAVLVQQGVIDLWPTLLTLTIGVIVGDSTLFFIARWFGKKIYKWTLVKRVLTDKRRLWLEEKIERHGGRAIFIARHIAPIRGATFALAAIHGLSYARFIAWDIAALMISLPIWMGLGWFFAGTLQELSQHTGALIGAIAGIIAFFVAGHYLFNWAKNRVQEQVDEEIEASSEGPALVMTDGGERLDVLLTDQATGRVPPGGAPVIGTGVVGALAHGNGVHPSHAYLGHAPVGGGQTPIGQGASGAPTHAHHGPNGPNGTGPSGNGHAHGGNGINGRVRDPVRAAADSSMSVPTTDPRDNSLAS